MPLFRLTDADDAADEYARGPRGLLDFDWVDKHGAMPSVMQHGMSNNLMMQPSGPDDPLWPLARYGVPRPPFGGNGPFFGFPNPGGFPLPGYPAPQGWGVVGTPLLHGYPGAEPPSGSVAIPSIGTGPSPEGAKDPARPPVRGLADLLLKEDGANAGYASSDSEMVTTPPASLMLAQASGNPAQNRPSLDYSLDAIERNFRNIVPAWRKQGLTESAKNLEWFLDGSGAPRIIGRDEARQFQPIREAEEINDSRFENAFLLPAEEHGHLEKLKALVDGQTITISDHWDGNYSDSDFAKQVIDPSKRDFALAFGNTKFNSKGKFEVTRNGGEIIIEGRATGATNMRSTRSDIWDRAGSWQKEPKRSSSIAAPSPLPRTRPGAAESRARSASRMGS